MPGDLPILLAWQSGVAGRGTCFGNARGHFQCCLPADSREWFGVRPALRGLVTHGPYRVVRHPLYLSYVIANIGFNLQVWNLATLFLALIGWAAMVYRIRAEERVISRDPVWPDYVALVQYRLVPGVW